MPSIKAVADVPIFNFFNSTQKPFLIPEYQRPYSWGEDQSLELFEDLKDFSANSNPSDTYFLGSIVFYTNQNQRREIVDGQQRIVTLFLLFHAIHEHLQSNSPLEMNLRGIIWKMNLMGDIIAPDKVRISSEATSDLANQKFIDILSNKAGNGDDNYSANYRLFQNQLRGFVKNQNAFLKFVNDLLNSTHILVIQANDFQSTLELFERINDRGLQLSDTDIFKADIYSKLDDSTRKEFINRWQNLEDVESMMTLFTYYHSYTRAKSGKLNLRGSMRQFLKNYLGYPVTMSDLEKISEIIQKMKDPNSSNWCLELQQALDIIWNSPSDHWRSAAIVYYIVHSGEIDFELKYLKFLHKLIATLTRIHAVTGTALSIRFPVLELNIQSIKSDHPNFPANDFTDQDVDNAIRQNGLITRTILRIIAYSDPDQKTILPSKLPLAWEIEHILPQNFQQNYAPKDPAIINAIGNLTPLEKSLNISAKNKSFNDKSGWYQTSSISMTKKIGSLDS